MRQMPGLPYLYYMTLWAISGCFPLATCGHDIIGKRGGDFADSARG